MTRFSVLVEVSLRPGIADPQGATIERALPALGFDTIHQVRTGKAIRFLVDADAEEGQAPGSHPGIDFGNSVTGERLAAQH